MDPSIPLPPLVVPRECKLGLWSLVLQLHLVLALLTKQIGASYCTPEQIDSCKTAVRSGSLNKLAGGGHCQSKRYIQFTHLCTVDNYVPTTDYCCCSHDTSTLCCRYHYNHDYFRCSAAEDTVDTIEDDSIPQKLLLAAILVPSAVTLCCVICCVRCLCCRDDDDDTPCGCSKCHKKPSSPSAADKYSLGRSKRHSPRPALARSRFLFERKSPLSGAKLGDVHKDPLATSSLCGGVGGSLGNGGILGNGALPTSPLAPAVPSAPPLDARDPALAHLLSPPGPLSPGNTASPTPNHHQPSAPSSAYYLHYVPIHSDSSLVVAPSASDTKLPPGDALTSYTSASAAGGTLGGAFSGVAMAANNNNTSGGSGSSSSGVPPATQTLIGILTTDNGTLHRHLTPSDPPPAYEDAITHSLDKQG